MLAKIVIFAKLRWVRILLNSPISANCFTYFFLPTLLRIAFNLGSSRGSMVLTIVTESRGAGLFRNLSGQGEQFGKVSFQKYVEFQTYFAILS